MPKLLLQKPSKSSKAKEQLKALERHMKLWDDGSIEDLSYESQTIRDRLRSDKECMVIAKISLTLKNLMRKGNVHGVLKLFVDNILNGLLPLNNIGIFSNIIS